MAISIGRLFGWQGSDGIFSTARTAAIATARGKNPGRHR